jgi:A/G-specific adenine glycosylase
MDNFATRLLAWHDRHGRKDLPWQHQPTPYRTWVSEIMLQQTQVKTVIPYFLRFIECFPDAAALAAAPLDEVLHLWSGLGYYSRARNLHATARKIRGDFQGQFPTELDQLVALPGIGRSTAGAILAQALGQRQPILDGNVKRVLTRFHMIEGRPNAILDRQLWKLAERHTPHSRVAQYTQAIMDLGATVCVRGQPRCGDCPLNGDCQACRHGRQTELPTPKSSKSLPRRHIAFVILEDNKGAVLLEQRPPAGLWGGLWGFPECATDADPVAWCEQRFGARVNAIARWPAFRHTFSHFHLDITPVHLRVRDNGAAVMESPGCLWYKLRGQAPPVGLAAPVAKLIEQLRLAEERTDGSHGEMHKAG